MQSKLPKSSSRNIKLTLEYDGSRFFGFQRQPSKPTIQSALEQALSELFDRPTKIRAAAGRTDSGVHAKGQVVNFQTASRLSPAQIQKGLNAHLPQEIVVKEAREVPAQFHARYGARWKTYEYLVWNSSVRSPLLDGRAFQFRYPLNLKRMREAGRELMGRRDFKAFQSTGSNVRTSRRLVQRLEIEKEGSLVRFRVKADGFLYRMVRRIVGALLELGRGALSLKEFREGFQRGGFAEKALSVPPQGLCLVSVEYPRQPS
jgi:tRNA pseudouridine38-40 synthase